VACCAAAAAAVVASWRQRMSVLNNKSV
jgi:hypothetical protein